jgi:hypothetical protein
MTGGTSVLVFCENDRSAHVIATAVHTTQNTTDFWSHNIADLVRDSIG